MYVENIFVVLLIVLATQRITTGGCVYMVLGAA